MAEPFDRASGIGGSDIACILGIDPFRSEWDLWLEKSHDPAWQPQEQTPPMLLGTLMEPVVAQLYEMNTGRRVQLHPNDDRTVWHPNGIMYAHIDGYAYGDPEGTGVFESKVPRSGKDWAAGVPMYYETQARSYRLITGAPWIDVAALFRDNAEFQVFRLYADQAKDEAIVARVEDWWERRIVRGEAPPMDGSDGASRYLAKRHYGPTSDEILPVGADLQSAVDAFISTKALISRYEGNQAALRNQIIDAMGEYAYANGDGWRIIFKRSKGFAKIKWEEVAKAYRRILEESLDRSVLDAIVATYTEETSGSRPLLIKEDSAK